MTTFSQVFALLSDDMAEDKLHFQAINALVCLRYRISKDSEGAILLHLLKIKKEPLVLSVMGLLGQNHYLLAAEPLIAILHDKQRSDWLRGKCAHSLVILDSPLALEPLRKIMFDVSDSLWVRTQAILVYRYEERIDDYIALLNDESADIRFWAAYSLGGLFDDIDPALEALDAVVAYDHRVPVYWGWHVDREAIYILERIYCCPMIDKNEWAQDENPSRYVYLISPATEYVTFIKDFRRWTVDRKYNTKPEPPVDLHIDPAWLEQQLRQRWHEIKINVRQPRPKAYLLDWQLVIDGSNLSGALHRDGYAVVLTATKDEAVQTFAKWYRSLFPAEQKLYLYQWAGEGVELEAT